MNLIDRAEHVSHSVEIKHNLFYGEDAPIVSDHDIVPSNYRLDEVRATVYPATEDEAEYVNLTFYGQRLNRDGQPDKRSRPGSFYIRNADMREEFRAYFLNVTPGALHGEAIRMKVGE